MPLAKALALTKALKVSKPPPKALWAVTELWDRVEDHFIARADLIEQSPPSKLSLGYLVVHERRYDAADPHKPD